MRKAALALLVTAVLVVGLLRYKTSSAPKGLRITIGPSQPPAVALPAPGPSPTPAASPTPEKEAAPPTSAAPPPRTTTTTRTITGPVEENQFGPVQVALTVQGSRVTDIETPQLPTDHARSAYISSVAGPILRQEALSAQSARIDTVSGATYTSDSFARSLQAALTQAGV